MDPFKCPIEGSCFGKRKGLCVILTSCAERAVVDKDHHAKIDCAFRKEYASKPKGWQPRTEDEKEWLIKEKEKFTKSFI